MVRGPRSAWSPRGERSLKPGPDPLKGRREGVVLATKLSRPMETEVVLPGERQVDVW